MQQTQLTSYHVWDRGIRWFHWINVLSVLTLLGTGLVIFNGKTIGLAGDAKILMKELHVWAGYLFATNLAWRIVQGFRGSHFARWRTLLPFGNGFLGELRAYLGSLRNGEPRAYLGHNPLGKLMVMLLFLLLITQAITGLLIAGTDLYYPPLGGWIAEWVAPQASILQAWCLATRRWSMQRRGRRCGTCASLSLSRMYGFSTACWRRWCCMWWLW